MGDGTLMEFGSVVDAVNFAVDVQQAMAARNAKVPEDRQITFRIGINIGDVILEGDDIYGDGVNVAARLEALAQPGGICVSRSVHTQVKGKVPFAFKDLGEQAVKNIPEPVQVFQVLLDESVPAHAPTPALAVGSRSRPAIAAGLVLSVLAVAALVWWPPWTPREEAASLERMAFPLPDKPSIAVLPFNDFSEDTSQEYFVDGLTEDLITDLSKISGLFVIARNSSFAYKGASVSIKEVAEDLGVRFVLEGSVRRAGDKLRVNAQLIDATTGGHVWADRFDGDVADIFAVQDEFVLKIVKALELKLSDQEESEIAKSDTNQIAAKEAFQRGWELYSRFDEQDNARAVSHFEKAVELDPEYGRAYGALALVYLRGSIFRWDQALGQQEAHLRRVVVPRYLQKASQRDSALVHVVKAMMHLYYVDVTEPEGTNRGTDNARREAGLAIARQPNDPEAHIMMAWTLIAAGKPQEGLNFVQAAMRLDPNYPRHYVFFDAAAHYGMGDLQQAANILRDGIKRDPHATELASMAASVYAHLGLRQEAQTAFMTWQPSEDPAERLDVIAHYSFPINWVNEHQGLNTRLLDGLRLASLRLDVTGIEHASAGRSSTRLVALGRDRDQSDR
jgi:TolB-like protein/Flp pilus assembly protein TadD